MKHKTISHVEWQMDAALGRPAGGAYRLGGHR